MCDRGQCGPLTATLWTSVLAQIGLMATTEGGVVKSGSFSDETDR
jgi:hypothetical protein